MGLSPPRRFQTAKAGNRLEECEDVSWISYPYSDGPARIALCDGASESAFAREWAHILSWAFVYSPLDMSCLDESSLWLWLRQCEAEWNRVVPWGRIPWHGEAKTRFGALSTLLGMTVTRSPDHSGAFPWQAVAIGDCCMFIVRDDALALSFPLEDSSQFNNTPSLICSNRANNGGLWNRVCLYRGECQPGDVIILASDAIACWILTESETGGRPWETMLSLDSSEKWEIWVEAQRAQRAMRNDDTTLIAVKVE